MIRPILFNTEMVQATLEGRKTVTRRSIKPKHRNACGFQVNIRKSDGKVVGIYDYDENEQEFEQPHTLPHVPGDILYVRETWQYLYELDGNEQISEGTGKYYYAATDSLPSGGYVDSRGLTYETVPWKPSIKNWRRLFHFCMIKRH